MKRRTRFLVALVALTSVLGLATVGSAGATTNVAGDASFDNGSGYDGRGDITTFGGDYRDNLITLSVSARIPTDPATDSNWINYNAAVIWSLDTNGDGNEDYWAIITNFLGVVSHVYRSSDNTQLCSASPTFDAPSGLIFTHFDASCIGTPSGFTIQAYFTYETASTDSVDFAPSASGFGAAVTRSITGGTTTTTTTAPPPPVDPPVTTAGVHDGYWMLTRTGSIYGFGTARNGTVGSNGGSNVDVHIEPTPTGNGYWILNEGGGITPKGDAATNLYSIGVQPGERAVSLSSTPSGKGLWVFTDRGRVVPLGDAQLFGDMSGVKLNSPILGSVATPTGKGYWMVASDGGIFSFGDAVFHGSTGGLSLNKPVMAMAPSPNGSGYWLVASDGGIFAFDVPFYGSMGSTHLNKPVSGMVPAANGYMMVAEDGGIFAFGNVPFHGSLGATPPAAPVVSVALQP